MILIYNPSTWEVSRRIRSLWSSLTSISPRAASATQDKTNSALCCCVLNGASVRYFRSHLIQVKIKLRYKENVSISQSKCLPRGVSLGLLMSDSDKSLTPVSVPSLCPKDGRPSLSEALPGHLAALLPASDCWTLPMPPLCPAWLLALQRDGLGRCQSFLIRGFLTSCP